MGKRELSIGQFALERNGRPLAAVSAKSRKVRSAHDRDAAGSHRAPVLDEAAAACYARRATLAGRVEAPRVSPR